MILCQIIFTDIYSVNMNVLLSVGDSIANISPKYETLTFSDLFNN